MADVRALGVASLAFPVSGAALAGDRLVVVSRNLAPTRVVVVDLLRGAVTSEHAVVAGAGAWGLSAAGPVVWIGVFGARGHGNLLRLDVTTGAFAAVAALDALYVWDVATIAGGDVVAALDPAAVARFDVGTSRARLIGPPDPAFALCRSIATAGDTVLVGGSGSGRALLDGLDARGRRSLLPPALGGHRTVYALAAGAGRVVAGTRGPGDRDPALALLDLQRPDASPVAALPGESVVDAISPGADAVYATSRPSGALHRWIPGRPPERLAVPVPRGETRGLFRHGGAVVGVGGDGSLWRAEGSAVTVTPLTDLGVQPHAELVMSLHADGARVYAGGNFGVGVRDVASGALTRPWVPGEPKDIATWRGTPHLAMYPGGEVWRLTADGRAEPAFALPPEQNRPQAVFADDASGLLVTTTASDRAGGGTVSTWDGAALRTSGDPLWRAQHPAGIAASGGLLVVGGSGGDPDVVGLDPGTLATVWRQRVPGAGTLIGMAALGDMVWGSGVDGGLVGIDPLAGRIEHRSRIASRGGRLAVVEGRLFAATGQQLLEVDVRTGAAREVLGGLGGRFWGWPPLASDGTALYVLRGDEVLQVRP